MARARPRAGSLAGRTVVITGGPTREYLDDIRFLSNASTGRMGIELARAAFARGADVTLVLGPTLLTPPRAVTVVSIVSAEDLLHATRAAAADADLVVFSAAPSDFRPKRRRKGKPPREAGGGATLSLISTTDVSEAVGRRKGVRTHVGFALEVVPGTKRALQKLEQKHLDAIVLNGPRNFGRGGGQASWLVADGTQAPLPTNSKAQLARAVITNASRLMRTREAG